MPVIRNVKCVKGYMVKSTTTKGYVQHIAVFDDGRVKITRDLYGENNPHFNQKGWIWDSIECCPMNAIYIGYYAANM